MKTVYNRFALIPFHCTDCHRYIWLEKYRKASVYRSVSPSVPSFTTRKICNTCLKKYNVDDTFACNITEQKKLTKFAKWVADEIFDDMWEYNKDAFAEIACRKLAKLGIVRTNGSEWELVEPKESEE